MMKILLVDDLYFYIVSIHKKLQRYFENGLCQALIDIALEPRTVFETRDVLSYDIIMTDNNMPHKDDGLIFISMLKEIGYTKKIILSSVEEIPEEKYSQFNMDITFMEQPVNIQDLYEFMVDVHKRKNSF